MFGCGGLTMYQPWDLVRVQYLSSDFDTIFNTIDVSRISKPDQINFHHSHSNKEIILRYYGSCREPRIPDYNLGRFNLVQYVDDKELIVKPITINNRGVSLSASSNGDTFEEYICTIRQDITEEEMHAIADFYKRIKYTEYAKTKQLEQVMGIFMDGMARHMQNSTYGLSGKQIQTIMPTIDEIFFNAPYTTVKWGDGTITTVKCTDNEEFNKEIGLAMIISRKYFDSFDPDHPRAIFKTFVKTATDQTEKTAAKRAYKSAKKQKLLEAVKNEKGSNDE